MSFCKLRLLLPVVVLALGLSVVGWSILAAKLSHPAQWVPLESRVSLQIDDWVGEDLPLGPNESTLDAVGRLNYRDYIYRVYRRGAEEVFIYAMFWRQGDISVREMSGHTPDGCWVSNGARHIIEPTSTALALGS